MLDHLYYKGEIVVNILHYLTIEKVRHACIQLMSGEVRTVPLGEIQFA